jgi:aspartyl-tRNA(Asn)/glutamyl-tRNA(Gln) amidotransferase subunit A
MTDFAALSARALAAAIRDGKVSSLEATQTAIQRLVACHELTHCIVSLEAADALDAARAVDAAIAAGGAGGALGGVPLAHKDMFDRAGKIASWGATSAPTGPPNGMPPPSPPSRPRPRCRSPRCT